MKTLTQERFNHQYQLLLQHLKLKSLQPKTVEAYSRSIRRLGEHFEGQIDALSEQQLIDYFSHFMDSHSKATVRLHFQGIKFFYKHVLKRPWTHIDLVKSPRPVRIPEIVSVDEVAWLFQATHVLSYKVFFFTVYSMGLRLSEGLALTTVDIDAQRQRVLIRDAKGHKDRLVPLPEVTLAVLRRFWLVHRHPRLIFPNRKRGLSGSSLVQTPLDKGGLQTAMRKVVAECGLKKRLLSTAYGIVLQLTWLRPA